MIRTAIATAAIAAAASLAVVTAPTDTPAPAPAPAPVAVVDECPSIPSGVAITPGETWTPDSRPACEDGAAPAPVDQTTVVTPAKPTRPALSRLDRDYLTTLYGLAPRLAAADPSTLLAYPGEACDALDRKATTYDLLAVGAGTDLSPHLAGSMTLAAVALYCPEHQPIHNVTDPASVA